MFWEFGWIRIQICYQKINDSIFESFSYFCFESQLLINCWTMSQKLTEIINICLFIAFSLYVSQIYK